MDLFKSDYFWVINTFKLHSRFPGMERASLPFRGTNSRGPGPRMPSVGLANASLSRAIATLVRVMIVDSCLVCLSAMEFKTYYLVSKHA